MSKVNPADKKGRRETQDALAGLMEIEEALARWICNVKVSPLPLSVKHGSLNQLLNILVPNFSTTFNVTPLSGPLHQDCLKIFNEQSKRVRQVLSKSDGRISLSVDSRLCVKAWDTCEYFDCITAHFIDNDWKLHNLVLMYSPAVFGNTRNVWKVLNDWGLAGRLVSLTGDFVLADWVEEEICSTGDLLLNGELFYVQSNCDMISQMVQSAFNEIDEIISKIKFLAWSKSPPLWYLTTFKLQNALKLKDMGKFTPQNVDAFYNVPSEEEWEKVRNICRITGRIYDITKPLYEAKTKTANLFLPLLLEIRTCILQESASSNRFVKELGEQMFQIYSLYWDEMYSLLSITAFLDPRFKMDLIKLKCQDKYAKVCGNLRKIYDSYSLKYDEEECVLSDSDTYFAEDAELVQEYNSAMPYVNDQSEKSDFDMYLEEPNVSEPHMENFSVLSWWKENSLKYPKLSLMARDLLAVSMSPGNGNELFYTEPRRVDSTLGSLEEQRLVNALSCTRSWKFL